MNKLILIVTAGGVLFLGGVGVGRLAKPMKVKAQSGCSVGSVQGNYVSQYTGFVFPLPGAPAMVPYAGIQQSVADGNGNITGSNTFSLNGVTIRNTFSGTYTVNPDCTGSTTFTDNFGNVGNADWLVANGGTRILTVNTQTGVTISAVASQQ
jgi:hypothetical protein